MIKQLKGFLKAETCDFSALPVLCLVAGVFWFTSLPFYSISIDQELAALGLDPREWVSQGRWTTYLLTRYVLPQPVIPYFPHFVFCISAAVSYLIVLRAHRISVDSRAMMLFPVFMAYPTWYFIGEFYANMLSVSVGLVLCCLALLVFVRTMPQQPEDRLFHSKLIWVLLLQSLVVGIAIGAYQSYLLAFCSMGLGAIIFQSVRSKGFYFPSVWKQLVYLLMTVIAGMALYWAVSLELKTATGVSSSYIDAFMKPAELLQQPWYVINSTFHEARQLYGGSSTIFGVSIAATGLLVILGLICTFYTIAQWKGRAFILILVSACMAAPFALNVFAGGAGIVPYRSMVGIPYVVWLFATIAVYNNQKLVKKAALVISALAALQFVHANSTYTAARRLTLDHDKALAAAIYNRITEYIPSFDRTAQYKVDFYGAKSYISVFPRVPTSTIGGSFFDWDGGNPLRIDAFMKLLGYEGLVLVSDSERNQLIGIFDEMPIWPALGSVRMVEDTFLVKLGNHPGVFHLMANSPRKPLMRR